MGGVYNAIDLVYCNCNTTQFSCFVYAMNKVEGHLPEQLEVRFGVFASVDGLCNVDVTIVFASDRTSDILVHIGLLKYFVLVIVGIKVEQCWVAPDCFSQRILFQMIQIPRQ